MNMNTESQYLQIAYAKHWPWSSTAVALYRLSSSHVNMDHVLPILANLARSYGSGPSFHRRLRQPCINNGTRQSSATDDMKTAIIWEYTDSGVSPTFRKRKAGVKEDFLAQVAHNS